MTLDTSVRHKHKAIPKGSILVVDDDLEMRTNISLILKHEGFIVSEAGNGKEALASLAKNNFNLILSDVRMPEMNGIELFKQVKNQYNTPFIMMTGFSDAMDLPRAYKLGVNEFLPKPFDRDELIACLELVSHQVDDEIEAATDEGHDLDSDFCRINIDDFISGSRMVEDIYLRLSASKYLRVARKGSPLSQERMQTYKSKGLLHLFLKKEDFANYLGFNLSLSKAAVKSGQKVTHEQKLHLLKHTAELCLTDICVNGIDREKFDDAHQTIDATLKVLLESKDLFSLLNMLKNHSDALYAHSVAVSLYSVMLAQEVGWTASPTQFKLSMAGLLHDIGKKEVPQEVLQKSRIEMTADDLRLYESHTLRGKEILSHVQGIPEDVIQVAVQHHENLQGMGFPFRISRLKIHPFSKLVSVVNEFCEDAIRPPEEENVEPEEVLEKMWSLKSSELDPVFMRGLMMLFNFPIPRELQNVRMMNNE